MKPHLGEEELPEEGPAPLAVLRFLSAGSSPLEEDMSGGMGKRRGSGNQRGEQRNKKEA